MSVKYQLEGDFQEVSFYDSRNVFTEFEHIDEEGFSYVARAIAVVEHSDILVIAQYSDINGCEPSGSILVKRSKGNYKTLKEKAFGDSEHLVTIPFSPLADHFKRLGYADMELLKIFALKASYTIRPDLEQVLKEFGNG